MTLKYTTVKGFWDFIGMDNNTLDFQPTETPARETVAEATVSAGDYYLNQLGVNEDTLVLYVGSSDTALTITTDYTFDSDRSKVTITSDGATALSGSSLTAVYDFIGDGGTSTFGKVLNYNKTVSLLEFAESSVEDECNCVFADQSATNPGYLKVVDELLKGDSCSGNLYQLEWRPIIEINTTTDGAFTLGDTELTVTSASGMPTSGTLYIGGNKVTYSSRTTVVLTVPDTTPSIASGSTVRGEVVEVSTSPSGVSPTYHVLTPDSDYAIDYITGEIQLMDDYYYAEDTANSQPQDGVFDRVRVSYMHAWHEKNRDAEIPKDIVEAIYMTASRNLVQRTILKSLMGQRDNFNPQSFGFSKNDISEKIQNSIVYRFTNV